MSNTPKQYSYENTEISVSFDGSKCAHAGFCFGQLHETSFAWSFFTPQFSIMFLTGLYQFIRPRHS